MQLITLNITPIITDIPILGQYDVPQGIIKLIWTYNLHWQTGDGGSVILSLKPSSAIIENSWIEQSEISINPNIAGSVESLNSGILIDNLTSQLSPNGINSIGSGVASILLNVATAGKLELTGWCNSPNEDSITGTNLIVLQ